MKPFTVIRNINGQEVRIPVIARNAAHAARLADAWAADARRNP